MEDTLRGSGNQTYSVIIDVLILVLMEDTLRGIVVVSTAALKLYVLILVLMEDTLRGKKYTSSSTVRRCLNPCFNGRYSQRLRNTLFSLCSSLS